MKVLGVFDADWIYTLPFLTGWLWASGGAGPKILRRLGVPLAISLYAIGYGISLVPLIVLLISTLALIGFGPGYGDDFYEKFKSFYWPYIFLLGAAYSLCQFGLVTHFGNFTLYCWASILSSCVFGGGMFLSKAKIIPWKVAELSVGASVGLTAALIIQ